MQPQYVIRLKRVGRWRKPLYHVVVMFKHSRTRGRFFEKLGVYIPRVANVESFKFFFIKISRLAWWLFLGAKVSYKVGVLLSFMRPSKILSKNWTK